MAAASASASTTTPTEHDYLEGFEEALKKESRKATFTCAGRLPINLNPNLTPSGDLTPRTNLKVHEQTLTTKPIRIRWGPNGAGKTLTLPIQTPEDDGLLQDLIATCHPATFGRAGQDILDPSYRRAGALGPADFMTDFCPYETGILDIVTQLLLPPIVGDLETQAPISEEGKDSGLTGEEDRKLHAALKTQKCRRVGWSSSSSLGQLHPSQLGPLFEELDVPFGDEDEAERLEDALDPERTGCVFEADVFAVAAERLIANRDAMSQVMEDPPFHSQTKRMLCRGLRAELYKLNVYSGPDGVFKPHVDTPRSASQIGSLVVCLPVGFEGGELAVRHLGQEIVHDWGGKNNTHNNTPAAGATTTTRHPQQPSTAPPPAINWSAFYSDCFHEVRPVHTGHRLTLTYNLYLSRGTGFLNTPPLLPRRLLPHALPLVPYLHHALANPGFKPKGGYLAFWLQHRYPHTQPVGCEFVVEMLKGADLGVLGAVRAVGLRCSVERVELFPGGRGVLDGGVWGRLQGSEELRGRRDYGQEGIPSSSSSSLRPFEIGDDPLNEEEYGEPAEDDFNVPFPEDSDDDDVDGCHPIVADVVTRLRRQRKERLTWIGREGRPEGEVSG
ncbi:hypothetical protein D0868_15372, partial [Hortaea werneckii]